MITESYEKFIDKLIEMTQEKMIEWEINEYKELVYKSSKATITISKEFDHNKELEYIHFSFYSLNQKAASEFKIHNLEVGYEKMEYLYELASASAINVEKEIEDFLAEIQG